MVELVDTLSLGLNELVREGSSPSTFNLDGVNGWVVEGVGLENQNTIKGIVGSNPTGLAKVIP